MFYFFLGEWKKNRRYGNGEFQWNSGDHFEGGFVDDMKSGHGLLKWKNGNQFIVCLEPYSTMSNILGTNLVAFISTRWA